MTLANMRENGVRAVMATCEACRREADVNVDALPETVTVPRGRATLPQDCLLGSRHGRGQVGPKETEADGCFPPWRRRKRHGAPMSMHNGIVNLTEQGR